MGVTHQHDSSTRTMALGTNDMIDRQNSDMATKYQRQKPTNIISNNSELTNRYNPNVHLTNRSGYNHNILSGHPNDYSSKLNISPREIIEKVAFRKKGLTDIVNHQYYNGEHPNYDHRNIYTKDKTSFNKKRG